MVPNSARIKHERKKIENKGKIMIDPEDKDKTDYSQYDAGDLDDEASEDMDALGLGIGDYEY